MSFHISQIGRYYENIVPSILHLLRLPRYLQTQEVHATPYHNHINNAMRPLHPLINILGTVKSISKSSRALGIR